MNERLKQLRKNLSLNQIEMAQRMNLSRSHISSLENGAREMTDRIIHDICREFNVNEDWMRTGKGELFIENDSSIIAELASEYQLDDLDRKIIEHYVKLDAHARQEIKKYVVSIAQDIANTNETAVTLEPVQTPEQIAAEEAEAYRLEILAELKTKKSSASDGLKGKSS